MICNHFKLSGSICIHLQPTQAIYNQLKPSTTTSNHLQARTLSNPVFGKLPCLEKEKKNRKDRGSRSTSERPGGKQLSLVTISETKSALNSSADVLSAVHSSKKNCLFCNADHNLTECSSFAKVPPTDRQEFLS